MPQTAQTSEDREHRKSRNRKIVMSFFLFIGCIVLLESPLGRIRKIEVSGNTTIPATRLISDSGVYTGQALWQIAPRRVRSRIAGNEPMVKTTVVSINWIRGSVHLHITERHVVAVLENNGTFYSLLGNGVVYHTVQASKGLSFPVVTATNGKLAEGHPFNASVSAICSQLSQISPQLLNSVSEFHANGDGTISMYLDNGFVVVCDASGLKGAVNAMQSTVSYFVSKGYKPGTIDLSGLPPYRYTPLQSAKKAVTNASKTTNQKKGATG